MTSPRHVLLVEDESAIADLVRTALEASGLRVTPCADVQSALRELDRGAFDLAILDLTLPDGSPDPLARRLADAGVPIIAISGDPARLATFAYGQGLEKPFRIRALLDRIKDTLPASR
ncbi:response regulator receiver protein [Gluconacetobacter diazotrophicus PA1 5]|uniref:Response regulator transcription factor n=2 Tax=Gluconacetobacter diazotrophicus TaxID=33996 RepID=A0A7W4NNE1_GLUDI|nr:response regulator [Gluconacetobacter diazotrophicus]ACI52937.1 response regulator receiver protein [Gluconacetobacter diazotrophicus PA1 5]MBB2157530.1 response regulator transcription factor [Gluconacetobacter diazotrophicus]TWB08918.1 response regulator receiver domain-containing protein [Gluconacetobacter diazotrophicus]CAP57094.1 putative two component transcriptional regulator, winged helix family [Gluconacetobacter diazotrophicus PA1 5]